MSEPQAFLLPWPPSVNTKQRYPTREYLEWIDDAGAAMIAQDVCTIVGQVEIEVELGAPSRRKWDLDNRAKAILDLLVLHSVIEDDNSRILRKLTLIARDSGLTGAMVTVIPLRVPE